MKFKEWRNEEIEKQIRNGHCRVKLRVNISEMPTWSLPSTIAANYIFNTECICFLFLHFGTILGLDLV